MNWLFIALISNLILGISAIIDKFILEKKSFNYFAYAFWASILGLFALILVPFGSIYLPFYEFLLAIFGGFIWFLASLFYFKAVSKSEASVALPLIGTLAPVFTLAFSVLILKKDFGFGNMLGFIILIFGGFFFFISEKKEARKALFIYAALAAGFFGLFNVLAKLTFNSGGFIAGVAWQRIGGAFAALIFLFLPGFSPFGRPSVWWKNKITLSAAINKNSHWKIYLFNRGLAAAGIILLYYAISLSHPSATDSIGSLKYAVIFLGAVFFLREHFKGAKLFLKITGVIFVIFGLTVFSFVNYASNISYDSGREILWGCSSH